MKFGLNCNDAIDPVPRGSHYLDLARQLEQANFNTVWMGDHVLIPKAINREDYPYPERGFGMTSGWLDPFSTLAAMGAVTSRLRLATGVMVVPYRPPTLLAHALATLSRLSDGRFIFALGVGWMKPEFEALGIPFEERGARTDESLQIIRSLLKGETPQLKSRFFAIPEGRLSPPPERPVPFYIGGKGVHVWRRTVRFGSGIYIANEPPEVLRGQMDQLRAMMEEAGRDFSELDICVSHNPDRLLENPDEILEYERIGVHELIFVPHWHSTDHALRAIERIARELRDYFDAPGSGTAPSSSS